MKEFNKFIALILFISLYSCALYDLDKPSSISLTIVDSAGKGIEGVSVTYTSDTENGETKTGSGGKIKINLNKGGVYQFTYSKAGYTIQSKKIFFFNGENKNEDIILTTLLNDAFFKVETKEKTIYNTRFEFTVDISTNVNYKIETSADWIKCTKTLTGLIIQCDSNKVNFERDATILLRGEYNLNDSIKIKQLSGSLLRVANYWGKNQSTSYNSVPFATFSHEITVVNATNGSSNIDFELSADKKTVYFRNLKLHLFNASTLNIIVKASDNTQHNFSLNFQLFINSQSTALHFENSTFFSKDNLYCWIYTSNNGTEILKQYSTSDFKETKQILNEEFDLMTYNPYNNCLYLFKKNKYGNKYNTEVKLIDANTGVPKNQFTIEFDGLTIESIAFSETGYGLMQLGNTVLMYIDAAKNHEIGIYSNKTSIYDIEQKNTLLTAVIYTYNNYKLFIMFGGDSNKNMNIYSSVPKSKEVSPIETTAQYDRTFSSNSGTRAVLTSSGRNLRVIDLLTKQATTVTLPSYGVGNVVFITGNDGEQYILTSKGSFISMTDFHLKNFTSKNSSDYMFSSANGKYIILNNNGKDYLYKSEMIINNSNFIY